MACLKTRRHCDIDHTPGEAAEDCDSKKSDGTYPLLTNDGSLSPTRVLSTGNGQSPA